MEKPAIQHAGTIWKRVQRKTGRTRNGGQDWTPRQTRTPFMWQVCAEPYATGEVIKRYERRYKGGDDAVFPGTGFF